MRGVTNVSNMFYGMSLIENNALTITGDNWDTSDVNNFSGMFSNANAFTSLDLSHFDVTSSVTNLSWMFSSMSNLTSLTIDYTKWDTSGVTSFSGMFYNIKFHATFDFSFIDTSSATNLSYMFAYFPGTSINWDTTKFTTSNVTNFTAMFRNASAMTSLNLTHFDTSSATRMDDMFQNMTNVTTLTGISNWDTSNVTHMGEMFEDCSRFDNT